MTHRLLQNPEAVAVSVSVDSARDAYITEL